MAKKVQEFIEQLQKEIGLSADTLRVIADQNAVHKVTVFMWTKTRDAHERTFELHDGLTD